MTSLSDRVESAVTKIEDSSDIAEKFADVSRTVEFDTPKGPVKPIGLLQQEAETAISSLVAFSKENFVATIVYDGAQKVYFVDGGVAYTPVSYPYTTGVDVATDVAGGKLIVLQGMTIGDTGSLDVQVPKNSDLHEVLSRIRVKAEGGLDERTLAAWMRDTIKCPGGVNTEIVAGVIRKNSIGTDTWSFLNNVDHVAVGVINPSLSITAVGENLTINFGKTYKRVVSFICGPDETLASKLNASVGASVGLESAIIRMAISTESSGVVRWNGSGGIQDLELGPFFVNAVTTLSGGVAHTNIDALSSPYVSKDDSISISPYSGSANIVPFMPCLKSYGYDSHDVNFISNYGSSFYAGGPSLNIGYLWNRSVCRPAILDGREAAAFESILAGPSSNIWFFGVFEV